MAREMVKAKLPKTETGSSGWSSIRAAVWQEGNERVEASWNAEHGLAFVDIGPMTLGYTPEQWAVIIRVVNETIPADLHVVDAAVVE